MQWYSAKDLEVIKTKKPNLSIELFLSFVGTTRFELATPSTPCLYATGLRYVPNYFWDSTLANLPRFRGIRYRASP
jgi:hypothetical protein